MDSGQVGIGEGECGWMEKDRDRMYGRLRVCGRDGG